MVNFLKYNNNILKNKYKNIVFIKKIYILILLINKKFYKWAIHHIKAWSC